MDGRGRRKRARRDDVVVEQVLGEKVIERRDEVVVRVEPQPPLQLQLHLHLHLEQQVLEGNSNSKEAELPVELWEEIGKRLVRPTDLVSFRSVSKLFRLALPSLFPLRVPPPPASTHSESSHFIIEVYFYSVELMSGQRMLVAFQQDPLHGAKVHPVVILPSGFDSEYFFLARPSFVAKAYHLVPKFVASHQSQYEFQYGFYYCFNKVVLISSNTDARVDGNYVSVVGHLRTGRIALLRLRGSAVENRDWNTTFCTDIFQDIAAYKGQLCALSYSGAAFLMDYNSLQMTQLASPFLSTTCYLKQRLFESSGDLYLVVRAGSRPYREHNVYDYEIYSLSLRLGKWVKVEGLCNQAFLQCGGFSIAIPRDAFHVNYGSRMMMKDDYFGSPSLLFSIDHNGKDGSDHDYCYIPFTTRHYPSIMRSSLHAAS